MKLLFLTLASAVMSIASCDSQSSHGNSIAGESDVSLRFSSEAAQQIKYIKYVELLQPILKDRSQLTVQLDVGGEVLRLKYFNHTEFALGNFELEIVSDKVSYEGKILTPEEVSNKIDLYRQACRLTDDIAAVFIQPKSKGTLKDAFGVMRMTQMEGGAPLLLVLTWPEHIFEREVVRENKAEQMEAAVSFTITNLDSAKPFVL